MPLITNRESGNAFSDAQSGWPNLTGTQTLNFTHSQSDTGAPNPTYTVGSNGLATFNYTAPAYGNTIVNFTSGSGTTLAATPANTPGSNRLVLIAVVGQVSTGTSPVPSITGCGLTWTQVVTQTIGVRRITVFRALGASPTSTAFSVTFSSSQAASFIWGYDFINCNTVATTAISNSSGTANTTASSITLDNSSTANIEVCSTVIFGLRNNSTSNTPSANHTGLSPTTVTNWSSANNSGIGDYLFTGFPGASTNPWDQSTLTWSTTGGNALVAIRLVGATSTLKTKTVVCTSGSTANTLQHGTIKFGAVYAGYAAATPQTMKPMASVFFWAPTSPLIDTYPTQYWLDIDYSASKDGSDSSPEVGTFNFYIKSTTSSGTTTLASSGAITEALNNTGSAFSPYRTNPETWDFKINLKKVDNTNSYIEVAYDIPPAPGNSTRIVGSFRTSNIVTPTSDLAYGIYHKSPNYVGASDLIGSGRLVDYFYISDTALIPPMSRMQGVNRSVVW